MAVALTTSMVTAQAQPPAPSAVGSTTPALIAAAKPATSIGGYIVLMSGEPAAVYDGGVTGFQATAAGKRGTYDSSSAAAGSYTDYLRDRQSSAAQSVGATAFYHYTTSLNGFAASLTASQVSMLRNRPGVLAVVKDRVLKPTLVDTPSYLGLTGPGGAWRRLGGDDPATGAGSGLTVGIIDSGVNDESRSFASVGTGVPADWNGTCQQGSDSTFQCNDKLIGGRYFDQAARAFGSIAPEEFQSPDDFEGHGTHVASTAAGEVRPRSPINGTDYGVIGGMAPAAKVASYKVCWEIPDLTTCNAFTSDSVAAIDAAVADGVDVINYSIGGSPSTSPIEPVELAFMYAADAGVFVAASAGNSGPTTSTVDHGSPWLTTVAAATYFNSESTVLLGDGTRMVGASISPVGVAESPLVYAGDILDPAYSEVPNNGLTADQEARLCFPGSIDQGQADASIVICDRGTNPRVEKSQVVADAGGVGMILVNLTFDGVVSDVHSVPTVHLEANYRDALLAYVHSAPNPTAAILAGVHRGSTTPTPPAIAGFSSRGPSVVAEGDLLKPDISAPGVDVDAATAPEGPIGQGNNFAIISGTSMSSPHIAGLAALILQKHPTWSPMEVKSAMMTTARNLTDTHNPFDQGAGFVDPREFMDPGLVYNSDYNDWADYLSGQGVTLNGRPFTNTPIRASNLNLASIAVNQMAGRESVKRTVTNVDDTTATYHSEVRGLQGLTTTVTPATLTLAPGETGSFRVIFSHDDAKFRQYTSGYLVWQNASHIVRSPVVVDPVGVDAPTAARIPARAGRTIEVRSGFTGTMGHHVGGLVAGVDRAGTAQNSQQAGDPLDRNNYVRPIQVDGPRVVVRLQTLPDFDADDLDLYLLDGTGAVVAESASPGASEQVTATGLPQGRYFIVVEAFDVHADAPSTTFTVRSWKVGKSVGNLTVMPATQQVRTAGMYSWRMKPTGLDDQSSYLGVVRWTRVKKGRNPILGETLVSVR